MQVWHSFNLLSCFLVFALFLFKKMLSKLGGNYIVAMLCRKLDKAIARGYLMRVDTLPYNPRMQKLFIYGKKQF